MKTRERLVVIGNGMAGARFVEDLLARGGAEKFSVTMFGDEPYGNYNRILLSGVLAGSHTAEGIFINPLAWYGENGITLHAGVGVERIDTAARLVTGAGGIEEPYDHLVIATGSAPFVPPIEGLRDETGGFREGAFLFRTLDDCDGMLRFAGRARRAAVIGGGLLGLEAARGLLNLGLEVHVVHLMDHLMEVQLDGEAGAVLAGTLETMGLHIHLEKATEAVLGEESITGLRFADGSELACDMVVVSAGIRPNAALARDAGLEVGRGIVVDDGLACSGAEGVYAVGECAQHRGQTYGLVAPLWEQTRTLADRLSGRNPAAVYEGSRLSTKLKVMGVELAVMGARDAADGDEVTKYSEPARGIYKKLIVRDGRLAGAMLLGDTSVAGPLQRLFDSGAPVPENRASLLFSLAGASGGECAADLPDDAQICNCNGVTKGVIAAAVQGGIRSLGALCSATRAGTGCGSCKFQVQEILEASAEGGVVDDPTIHYYVPGIPLAKPELIAAVRAQGLKSVSAVFRALADGREDPASKAGLASLLRTVWGKEYEDERDARYINDRVHANIQNNGTFSVIPRIYGGVTSADQLRRIADVADKYSVPMVKITGGQRIDLLGIKREDLPDVWQDLGMPSGHAYSKAFRTCKTCVGTEFCRYGVGDSTKLGIEIEERFQGLESPAKLKLATAGCPRNCSEATTKDVGAVAIEGGRWEIYVGGAAGSRVRKGDVLCTVDSHEDTLLYMGRFMQYYREHAKYLERTYDFVERLGIERLRSIIVDDSEGIAAALDAEMQAAVDAYVDPWKEAETPQHPAQFKPVLEPACDRVRVLA
jgi:nitrite reductase (NADH) large subunit